MSFLPPEEVKISYSVYRKLANENKKLQNELIEVKKQLALYNVMQAKPEKVCNHPFEHLKRLNTGVIMCKKCDTAIATNL